MAFFGRFRAETLCRDNKVRFHMYNSIRPTETVSPNRGSFSGSHWPRGFVLTALPLVLTWLGFSPSAQAVCNEGCDTLQGNTFLGVDALGVGTSGYSNTAVGEDALFSNISGSDNTANGFAALQSNTTGTNNTAQGAAALQFNTTGVENTANGAYALESNSTGSDNKASVFKRSLATPPATATPRMALLP